MRKLAVQPDVPKLLPVLGIEVSIVRQFLPHRLEDLPFERSPGHRDQNMASTG